MTVPQLMLGVAGTAGAAVIGVDVIIAQTFTVDPATLAGILAIVTALGGLYLSISNANAANRRADEQAQIAAEERKIAEEERKAIATQLHDVKGQNRVIEGKVDGTATRANDEIKALRDTVARLEAASIREEKRAELLAQAVATRPLGPIAAVVNGPSVPAELDVHASAAATQAKAAEVQVDAAETQLKAAKGE